MTCDKCNGRGVLTAHEYKCTRCLGTGSRAGIVRYAGIGARKTPVPVMDVMSNAAVQLAMRGFVLHSGHAGGADTAFETGCKVMNGRKVIRASTQSACALAHAAMFHPNWEACSTVAKGLHARNSQILLGDWLDDPVSFVLCWTEGGQIVGGTGQAIRVASAYSVPVFNLAVTPIDALWSWLNG